MAVKWPKLLFERRPILDDRNAVLVRDPKIRAGAPSFLGGRLWLPTSYLSTSETRVVALTSLWPPEAAARPFPQLSRSKGHDRGFSWRDSRQRYSSGHSHFLTESAVCTPEDSG